MLNEKAINEELFFVEWLIDESTFVLQPEPSLDVPTNVNPEILQGRTEPFFFFHNFFFFFYT